MAIGREPWRSLKSYSLTAIPLFVLMAEILLRADVTKTAYRGFATILGPLPGGAAYANIGGSTLFAAISGSSVANAAAMGTVAGPAMTEMGYSRRLTFGSIAAGGGLGILMPPSTALIIYGSLSGVSISALFIGGMLPALLLACLFSLVIMIWGFVRPDDAPRGSRATAKELLSAVVGLFPLFLLMTLVLGGIYLGIFTPTEAGGIGALGAAALAAGRRKLGLRMLWESAAAATTLSSMILLIIAGAAVIGYVIGMLGVTFELAFLVADAEISITVLLALIALGYIILGLFIESVSLIVLTVPVLYPVLSAAGVDGVWLGIYIVVLIEIGLITPPVGLNLFVLKSISAGQTMNDIIIGAIPFLGALLGLVALLLAFPQIATWLPSMA
ncbi:tripartite ATP-independent transporter DctM subunit [Natronocella acetinitrilica]|uniref:TRAP transporter large permease protein n=2 Tax=Natronocella acetinitrilica TaxID=414046 RepID=A0AAE3G880_9GAMM|nr:tripartite ATP-independent transporter DctM subunit [Natronocella acetinitrilica]